MSRVRNIGAKDKCSAAIKRAADTLGMLGIDDLGKPKHYYMRRKKRGTELWLQCGTSFHLNLSNALNYWPRNFTAARKYMQKHFDVPEKKERKPPKLTLIVGGR